MLAPEKERRECKEIIKKIIREMLMTQKTWVSRLKVPTKGPT